MSKASLLNKYNIYSIYSRDTSLQFLCKNRLILSRVFFAKLSLVLEGEIVHENKVSDGNTIFELCHVLTCCDNFYCLTPAWQV